MTAYPLPSPANTSPNAFIKKVDDHLAIILGSFYDCGVNLQSLSLLFDRERKVPNPQTQSRLHWHHWSRAISTVRNFSLSFTSTNILNCGDFSDFMAGAINVEELHVGVQNLAKRADRFLEGFTLNKLRRSYLFGMDVYRSVILDFIQRHESTLEYLHFRNCCLLNDEIEAIPGRAHYHTSIDSVSFTNMIAANVAAVSQDPHDTADNSDKVC